MQKERQANKNSHRGQSYEVPGCHFIRLNRAKSIRAEKSVRLKQRDKSTEASKMFLYIKRSVFSKAFLLFQ